MNIREKMFREAEAKQRECQEWLKRYMSPGQPKAMTKNELFEVAKRKMGISRAGFDHAWIAAIEEMGRQDWYEPLRGRRSRLH